MNRLPSTLRSAAILIDSLDPQSADALIERMPLEQAARIRRAVMELEGVNGVEREAVLQSFIRTEPAPATAADLARGGVELEESLAARFGGTASPSEVSPGKESAPQFLKDAPVDSLAAFLSREHPQTIAVVLAQVMPNRAALVLERLDPDLQADVLYRVTHLDETAPEILDEIQQELESRLSQELSTSQRRMAGISAARAILAQANSATRQQIVAQLAGRDPGLAQRIVAEPEPSCLNNQPTSPSPDPAELQQTLVHEQAFPGAQTPVPGTGLLDATCLPANQSTAPERHSAPRGVSAVESDSAAVPKIDFQDLESFDDAALAKVLAQVDPQITLLALAGARNAFVERILNKLSPREAKILKKKMRRHAPMQLRDVDRAQQHIVRVAQQLADGY